MTQDFNPGASAEEFASGLNGLVSGDAAVAAAGHAHDAMLDEGATPTPTPAPQMVRDPATGRFVPQAPAAEPVAPVVETPAAPATVKIGDQEFTVEQVQEYQREYEARQQALMEMQNKWAEIQERERQFQAQQEETRALQQRYEAELQQQSALRELALRDPEAYMALVNSQVVRGQQSPYGQPQPQQQPALTLDQIRAAIREEMETKAKQEAAASREVGFRDFLASEIRGRAVDSKVFGDLEPIVTRAIAHEINSLWQAGRIGPDTPRTMVSSIVANLVDQAKNPVQKLRSAATVGTQQRADLAQRIPPTSTNGVTPTPKAVKPEELARLPADQFASFLNSEIAALEPRR